MRLLFDQIITVPPLDDYSTEEQMWIRLWAYVLSDRGQRELKDIPESYTRAYKEVKAMLTPLAEKAVARGGEAKIVYPMQLLTSKLPSKVFATLSEMRHKHPPLRRMRWRLFKQVKEAGVVSWSQRTEVNRLLDFIETADADPMGHVVTLLLVRSANEYVPLISHWCSGCGRDGSVDKQLQEAVEEMGDRIHGPNIPSAPALVASAKRDLLLVHAVLNKNATLEDEIKEALDAGQRGRLFIQKHRDGAEAAWQSLQQVRRGYRQPLPSTDHTLEWIEQMPLDEVLVASICDGFGPDAEVRTVCLPQPWLPIEKQLEMQQRWE